MSRLKWRRSRVRALMVAVMVLAATAVSLVAAAPAQAYDCTRVLDVYRPGGMFVQTGTTTYPSGYWWSEAKYTHGCSVININVGYVVNTLSGSPYDENDDPDLACASVRVRLYPTSGDPIDGDWYRACLGVAVRIAWNVRDGTRYRIRWQETSYPWGTDLHVPVANVSD